MCNSKFKSKIEPEVSHVVENETSQMGSDLGHGDTDQQLAQELRIKASSKDRSVVGPKAGSGDKRSTMKLFG